MLNLAQEVIQLSTSEVDKLIQYYKQNKIDRHAPGVVFAAKLSAVAITVYKSGKVLFQGNDAHIEASRWGATTSKDISSLAPSPLKTKGDTLPSNFENCSVIGTDETGTGDYFGPVTVAAVYVPSEKIQLLKELGIKDSKMLTDEKMLLIADNIKATCPHSILVLRNEKYNAVQQKGWSQGKIKALLHNKALLHVLNKINPIVPEYILIDQFAERDVYYRHIQNEKEIVRDNVLFSTKAEQLHIAVAAASILARVAFLKEMDKISNEMNMVIPKGASKKVDEIAANILLSKGEQVLQTITKWHFANTEKAKKLASAKKNAR